MIDIELLKIIFKNTENDENGDMEMTEKPKKTPKEELKCLKKYVYDTGIIFECTENSRVEIISEDVVDLLNELTTKCSKLEKENEQLKKDVDYWKQIASQYNNVLNVYEHCKKQKTECKDIHWSSD